MVPVASDSAGTKLKGVARRPARGSLKNFFGDLRDLLRYGTLKATVQEFLRDDALGLAAQLAFYLDTGDLPVHPVLRRHTRRLLQLRPAVRHGSLRLPQAAPAGAGLRPDPHLHGEHAPQRRHRPRPPLRRHPRHGLGRLRRLRRPDKRPQPRLRRAGDAAVLEGEGHRHPDDVRPLGAPADGRARSWSPAPPSGAPSPRSSPWATSSWSPGT